MNISADAKMDNRRAFSLSVCNKTFVALLMLLFSFPAAAKVNTFSFIEFNIAFLLGLSLPLLLLTSLAKKSMKASWRYPVVLVISLLTLLYASNHVSDNQQLVILASSVVFLSILSVWPILTSASEEYQIASANYIVGGIALSAFGYIATLFFYPKLDAYLVWLLVSGLILLLAFSRLIIITAKYKISIARNVALWLLACVFATALYLWLTVQVSILWLVVSAMLAYLMAMLNTSWSIVKKISQQRKEIEHQKQENAYLVAKPSIYDPITNLPSYAHAIERFGEFLKDDEHKSCAAIVFKPINFKKVNKVLGHQNSDLLLLQFAYCLQKHLENDSSLLNFAQSSSAIRVARLQSLNFLVVLDLTDEYHPERSVIESLCQQLVAVVPEAMSFKSFSLNFELAFGVALHEYGDSAEQLIANAGDALLMGEKQHQTIAYFDQESILYNERQLLKMERLKQDIEQENLTWRIQPQVELSSKELKGFELQVFWHYQREQLLALDEFVSIAEFSGELYRLTRTMLKQAFHALHRIHQAGVYQPISVNLSSQELLEPDLVDYIEQQLSNYSLSAKYFVIELNETVLLNASERAKLIIDQLRVLGVRICISDFSGSYEALRYLRRLTVQQVKVNCHNIASLEHKEDKAIANALVNLAQVMKLPLIGYGVDTAATGKVFQEVGGRVLQGKVIEDGVELEAIEPWLESWQRQHPSR